MELIKTTTYKSPVAAHHEACELQDTLRTMCLPLLHPQARERNLDPTVGVSGVKMHCKSELILFHLFCSLTFPLNSVKPVLSSHCFCHLSCLMPLISVAEADCQNKQLLFLAVFVTSFTILFPLIAR